MALGLIIKEHTVCYTVPQIWYMLINQISRLYVLNIILTNALMLPVTHAAIQWTVHSKSLLALNTIRLECIYDVLFKMRVKFDVYVAGQTDTLDLC